MFRPLTCTVLLGLAFLLSAQPAEAARSYDNCSGFITSLPATITTQGVWCMDRDLATNLHSGSAILVATNNVILDCNDFKLGNLAAGAETTARGVHANARLNTTVRNCNIRGFYIGLYLTEGGGHLGEDNRFDGNTSWGIYVTGAGSTLRNNFVIDTGGSIATTGPAHGIMVENGVDVLNNTVNGVAPVNASANAYGIRGANNGEGSINGNRVRGLVPGSTGNPYGIFNIGADGAVMRDNDVRGPGVGVAGGWGVTCSNNATTARDNAVSRFATAVVNCLESGNIVNSL